MARTPKADDQAPDDQGTEAPEFTPSPAPPYPLPDAYAYGPDTGAYTSVSGRLHVRRDTYLAGDDGLALLQGQLTARGYSLPGATGLWDEATAAAVAQLQADVGLAEGPADAATWRAAWETRAGADQ